MQANRRVTVRLTLTEDAVFDELRQRFGLSRQQFGHIAIRRLMADLGHKGNVATLELPKLPVMKDIKRSRS